MANPALECVLPSGEVVRLLTRARHVRAVPIFFPEWGLDWGVEIGEPGEDGVIRWRVPFADEIVGFADAGPTGGSGR